MSAIRALPPYERLLERENALIDLIGLTITEQGLRSDAEAELWPLLKRRIERLVEIADAAVAARVSLQAHDERIDRHVQTHRGCVLRRECSTYRALQRQRSRLQRNADRALRALLGE